MAILQECHICRRRQSLRNKVCKCGSDLDKAKRAGRVEYWIVFRVDRKQRREKIGKSIEEARAA